MGIFDVLKPKKQGTVVKLKLSGLHCTSCAMSVDGALEDIKGVFESKTSYAKMETTVRYDGAAASPKEMIKAIKELGYTAKLSGSA